jgi:hypothetical protein
MGGNVLEHPFLSVAERKKGRDIRTASSQAWGMTKTNPFEQPLLYPGPFDKRGKNGGRKKKKTAKPRRKRR